MRAAVIAIATGAVLATPAAAAGSTPQAEDGFRIERCAGSGCADFAQVAVVGHDVKSHVDGGLARNAAYSYRVRAFNAGGVSGYSNTASARTRRK